MTLQKLRYIIEIVNSGSISEASKKLFISQPSLSNALKEIEEDLGFEIFTRTNKGVILSSEGAEFLGYARQIVEQVDLMEQHYLNTKPAPQHFSISTQHYAFVVKAFVDLVKEYGGEEYEFTFRDTRTYEILEDVRDLRSEVGILYLNSFNSKVLGHMIKQYKLEFHPLFTAEPHVFVSSKHPLTKRDSVTLEDLEPYPALTFEQGKHNSFYYSEEVLSYLSHKKHIRVSDRATIFNLMIGLNGYTISTGILNSDLNGEGIVAIPLESEEEITVGFISHEKVKLSQLAETFISLLEKTIKKG